MARGPYACPPPWVAPPTPTTHLPGLRIEAGEAALGGVALGTHIVGGQLGEGGQGGGWIGGAGCKLHWGGVSCTGVTPRLWASSTQICQPSPPLTHTPPPAQPSPAHPRRQRAAMAGRVNATGLLPNSGPIAHSCPHLLEGSLIAVDVATAGLGRMEGQRRRGSRQGEAAALGQATCWHTWHYSHVYPTPPHTPTPPSPPRPAPHTPLHPPATRNAGRCNWTATPTAC